jgi:hypothetical protein
MYEVGEYSILSISTSPTRLAQLPWSVLHATANCPAVRAVYGDKKSGNDEGSEDAAEAE